jgi:hypothetical protein
MISVDALYRVPDGITELPDGTILGAFLLGEETRPKPGTSPDGTGTPQTAQPDVRRWLADDRIRPEVLTAETADDQAEEWSEIVLTLDLVRLATEISRVEGR